jgi:ketosteroid isomerase-like protein
MSEENVEIVRRSFAAYDSGGLDALAEFWHPDIDWRAVEGYIDDVGLIRGPDGLRQYYRQWRRRSMRPGSRSRS